MIDFCACFEFLQHSSVWMGDCRKLCYSIAMNSFGKNTNSFLFFYASLQMNIDNCNLEQFNRAPLVNVYDIFIFFQYVCK